MNNFGELCAEVITLTARPDLLADTQLAVRRATLFLHGFDTWYRDLQEKKLTFSASSYNFSIDTSVNFARFRSIKYIKTLDDTSGKPIKDVHFCPPDNLWDEFGNVKKDVYYIAGKNLNMNLSVAADTFIIAWFEMPSVIGSYNSWIAELCPYAIVDLAAGRILQAIGMVDEGNKFVDPVKGSVFSEHIPWLRTNGLRPEA